MTADPDSAAPQAQPITDGPLVDRYSRVARDLRVSLTDRCNLRCTYCMPADGLAGYPPRKCSPTQRSSGW